MVVQTRKASRYIEARYIRGARATIKHLVGMRRDSARVGRASSADERQIQHNPSSEARRVRNGMQKQEKHTKNFFVNTACNPST